MVEERPGSWFGFGFCGFRQALGSGCGHQVHSFQPLCAPDRGGDICSVRANWSYTAFLSGAGQVQLSCSAGGAAEGYRDLWASMTLLVVPRDVRGPGPGAELQAGASGSDLRGEPLWALTVMVETERDGRTGGETREAPLPLLCAHGYVSPRSPLALPLAPELRARQMEVDTERALLLDEAGQMYFWGGAGMDQLDHRTLEAELGSRLLEALRGLPMAEAAWGGGGCWHSISLSETGDIYIWGNESGRLALPSRSLAVDKKTVSGKVSVSHHFIITLTALKPWMGLNEDGSEVKRTARAEDGAPDPFIALQPSPPLLDLAQGTGAVKACCGSWHTAVVMSEKAGEDGEGSRLTAGIYGQLGRNNPTSWDWPCCVEYFVDKQLPVMAVSCGPWNTYVYAVEKERADEYGQGHKGMYSKYRANSCETPTHVRETHCQPHEGPAFAPLHHSLLGPSPYSSVLNLVLTLETPTELRKWVPKAIITDNEIRTSGCGF
ncbi:LOW QUALITY PROTEIN: RCC1 domain-containing protein 1-like [Rhynchonycteris naso]